MQVFFLLFIENKLMKPRLLLIIDADNVITQYMKSISKCNCKESSALKTWRNEI